jgi:hypothetical protein
VEKDYEMATSLSVEAVKQEFYNPEIYKNLGRILYLKGQKGRAFKAYKKGLVIDDTHQGLLRGMKEMGMRRSPPIAFLGRGNPVNKLLGKLVHGLPKRFKSSAHQPGAFKKRR